MHAKTHNLRCRFYEKVLFGPFFIMFKSRAYVEKSVPGKV